MRTNTKSKYGHFDENGEDDSKNAFDRAFLLGAPGLFPVLAPSFPRKHQNTMRKLGVTRYPLKKTVHFAKIVVRSGSAGRRSAN